MALILVTIILGILILILIVLFKPNYRIIDRFLELYTNVRTAMDVFEVYYLGQDGIEPDDIPKTDEPVWILGKKYNAVQGLLLDFFFWFFLQTLLLFFF